MREFEQDLGDVLDLESVDKDFKSVDTVMLLFKILFRETKLINFDFFFEDVEFNI